MRKLEEIVPLYFVVTIFFCAINYIRTDNLLEMIAIMATMTLLKVSQIDTLMRNNNTTAFRIVKAFEEINKDDNKNM